MHPRSDSTEFRGIDQGNSDWCGNECLLIVMPMFGTPSCIDNDLPLACEVGGGRLDYGNL